MKLSKASPFNWLLIALGALAILSGTAFAVKTYGHVTDFDEYVQVAGVLVNLVGFLLVFQQLRAASQAAENQTRWEIEQVSFNVYNLLVHKPKLRPYFYDGVSPPLEGEERWEVDAACELFLDYFETIVGSSSAHDDPSEEVWRKYMKQIYDRSPALKVFLNQECHRYRIDLLNALDHGLGEREEERRKAERIAAHRA